MKRIKTQDWVKAVIEAEHEAIATRQVTFKDMLTPGAVEAKFQRIFEADRKHEEHDQRGYVA